jgi:hypothetical protein
MSQSLTASNLAVSMDDLVISNADFSPIPNSIYGIKGKETSIKENFRPSGNKVDRIRITFQFSDRNASGYFDYLGFGIPSSGIGIKAGIYSKSKKYKSNIRPSQGLSVWEISDFFDPNPLDFSDGNLFEVKKIVVFDPEKSSLIQEIKPAKMTLRNLGAWPELLIISPAVFTSSAEKLRVHKLGRGVFAEVVYLEEIYDSFGYGNRDLNAIRNMIAWHFQYGKNLKNVLIFG